MDSLIPIFVDIDVACSSKKKALAVLAAKAAEALPVDEAALFTALNKRERLGTTGIGGGVALPNAAAAGISTDKTLFLRFSTPVDFDALDDEPIDLLVCHLSPADALDQDRLRALAKLNNLMSDPSTQAYLRGAESRAAVSAILEDRLTD